MKSTQPPRFATWLLRHLGSSPHTESIIGDLIEQHEHDPSSAWYWNQCLKAIVVGLFNECRAHIRLTVRASLIGWTVLLSFPRTYGPIRELFFALAIWSRWWRRDWIEPSVYTFHALVLCIIAGWLIARFHRPHQTPMVLMFTVSSCCVTCAYSLEAAIEGFRWWPIYVVPLVVPIGILFGGGLFRRNSSSLPSTAAT